MDIESISNFTSIAIASFLGIHFLFSATRYNRAPTFLGLFLLFTAISVAASELEAMRPLAFLYEGIFALCSPFLFAPILLYYALAITNTLATKGRRFWWVFVPVLPDIVLNITLGPDAQVFQITILLSSLFSLFIYFLIIKELRFHNEKLLKQFSAIEDKKLRWLKFLVAVNIGFTALWLLDDSLVLALGENVVSISLAAISMIATLITILWIGFAGLRQVPIFDAHDEPEEEIEEESTEATPDLLLKFERIVNQITNEKLYLDHDLSLGRLAAKLEVRNKELSQIINQGFGENFYHFINHFRVEHYKTLVANDANRNLSIDGLATQVGFKSKSTFYAAFKKVEGMTPKQYELGGK